LRTTQCAPVAQLDRAPDYESGGWVFESPRARQSHDKIEQAQARFTVDSFTRLRSSNLTRLTVESRRQNWCAFNARKKLTMLALAGSVTYSPIHGYENKMLRLRRLSVVYLVQLLLLTVVLSSCSSSSTGVADRKAKSEPGFFERLMDQLSARECNVVRFTCPYGFGAAGEPCDCTDPRGVVLFGRTIK
jgi:hypothetical protein